MSVSGDDGRARMGRPSKYRPEMCDTVLELGRTGCSQCEMMAELEIALATWQDWLNPESPRFQPEFSVAVKEAVNRSQAWWERKGREATFESKDFSATSYIFQMKNRFREHWNDRVINEQSGSVKITWGSDE